MQLQRRLLKIDQFLTVLSSPYGPWGAGKMKFTIYALLKMLHYKFENNWNNSYREVRNIQLLTHNDKYYIHGTDEYSNMNRIIAVLNIQTLISRYSFQLCKLFPLFRMREPATLETIEYL